MKQTVMLGFSDGTKDGGYFMANWSIYKAKESLSSISSKYGIKIAFFDGRGGPPARGGGNTHQFYASLGESIQSDDIQLTIQGQTISSNFGTLDSSQYNLEQLLSSGISNQVKSARTNKSAVIILKTEFASAATSTLKKSQNQYPPKQVIIAPTCQRIGQTLGVCESV